MSRFERAAYGRIECVCCGALVSNGGLAKWSHFMKHVREDRMIRTKEGRFELSLREAVARHDGDKL